MNNKKCSHHSENSEFWEDCAMYQEQRPYIYFILLQLVKIMNNVLGEDRNMVLNLNISGLKSNIWEESRVKEFRFTQGFTRRHGIWCSVEVWKVAELIPEVGEASCEIAQSGQQDENLDRQNEDSSSDSLKSVSYNQCPRTEIQISQGNNLQELGNSLTKNKVRKGEGRGSHHCEVLELNSSLVVLTCVC